MTKLKKAVQNSESKAQERKFFTVSLIVTAVVLFLLYLMFRNAF
jgi:hypothetical protein